eukprot:gnl/Ergobibamus_cyprinoides/4918.p3 GENE.gnl/Ergobibamus_cyprinoides/4918~~gnl/Ergobibamus_cyprinoides/4918.p3  ORF type:complete len:113 (+),score=26.76 gnl/Ergobibamus_cyprinoides/4918:328-666(+)
MEAAFAEMDKDGSGTIDFPEFVDVCRATAVFQPMEGADDYIAVFRSLANGPRSDLSWADLSAVMKTVLTPAEVDQLHECIPFKAGSSARDGDKRLVNYVALVSTLLPRTEIS